MKNRTISSFETIDGYIKLETPIDLGDCAIIGWFPYETSKVFFDGMVKITRSVFSELENKLMFNDINDNKYTIIVRSKFRSGDDDFAIYFKDLYAIVGNLDNVKDYQGNELKQK